MVEIPKTIYVSGKEIVSATDVADVLASLSEPPLNLNPEIVGDQELRDLGWHRYVLAEPTEEMVDCAALALAREAGEEEVFTDPDSPYEVVRIGYRESARQAIAAAFSTSSEEANHG